MLVAALSLAGATLIAGFSLANPLLAIRDLPAKADVIVVLGGDGPSRAAWAANLWMQGWAPRVLISGDGDCLWIRKGMLSRGVDPRAITVECQSGSTGENAAFSAPILKQMEARTAILVTSWYHSRRAVASFTSTSAAIRWLSVPVEPKIPLRQLAFTADGMQLLKEYPKMIWYAARSLLGLEPTAPSSISPVPVVSPEVKA
jgi:uncharacterized SAM-binding protein YcdF (DUF218 family)